MKKLTGISDESIQRHILLVGEKNATMTMKFLSNSGVWIFDIEYNDQNIYGLKFSIGVLHLANYNFPFDLILTDTDNSGIDPFKIDDFFAERILLYQLEPNELSNLRGYSVEI